MTALYTLRDVAGRMRAQFKPEVMALVERKVPGTWRPYHAHGKPPTRCFEPNEKGSVVLGPLLRLHLRPGDRVVERTAQPRT